MKVPFEGKVNPLLLNRFYKDKVFYVVRKYGGDKQGFYIDHGTLNIDRLGQVSVAEYSKTTSEKFKGFYIKYHRGVRWDNLFETYKEAKDHLKYLNDLHYNDFDKPPFINTALLQKLKGVLVEVQNALHVVAGEDQSVNFSDVSAGGIQVYCGDHRETLDYSGGNKIKVLVGFIKHFNTLKEK